MDAPGQHFHFQAGESPAGPHEEKRQEYVLRTKLSEGKPAFLPAGENDHSRNADQADGDENLEPVSEGLSGQQSLHRYPPVP